MKKYSVAETEKKVKKIFTIICDTLELIVAVIVAIGVILAMLSLIPELGGLLKSDTGALTPFLEQVFKNDAYGVLQHMEEITEEERLLMCDYYARLNYKYYQGKAVEIREDALVDEAYALWDSKGYITVLRDYVVSILNDADRDYNRLEVE